MVEPLTLEFERILKASLLRADDGSLAKAARICTMCGADWPRDGMASIDVGMAVSG
jgi:hypothetical protein